MRLIESLLIESNSNELKKFGIKELADGLTLDRIKSYFPWVLKAKIQDAVIGVETNRLKWYSGKWKNGIWEDGFFYKGIWEDGTFKNGWFKDSTWKNGDWFNGWFKDSTWKNGKWLKGEFENSTWLEGEWRNGEFKNSTWDNGYWYDGNFYSKSTWKNGIWHNGNFYGSTWKNGNFHNGEFSGSIWENGISYNGEFYNFVWKKGTFKNGRVSENSTWENGTFENGTFQDSTWKNGSWKNGTWINSQWKSKDPKPFKENTNINRKANMLVKKILESSNYKIYHNTYTNAIDAALNFAEKKGYEIDKEETAEKIGMGNRKPSIGKTNKFSIHLYKYHHGGNKLDKKMLHIQVYNMGEKYELNCYIN